MADKRNMETKTFPALGVKVVNEAQGIVEHVITVFGVYDKVGDISHPGSFRKTLAERGNKVRVVDSHDYSSVLNAIGKPLEIREIGRGELPPDILTEYPEATGGVWARTQFLMDTPEGKGTFIRLKEGAVDEWSYGYDALDVDYSKMPINGDEVAVRNLRSLRLWEYSPVLWGANPATATMSAKDAKPAPEVTENTIRIRVRAPGDFQEDSFRTISIGDDDNGIQAVVGRLEGESSTTVQSYVFDKEKWTVSEAQAWVEEHEKADEVVEDEKAGEIAEEEKVGQGATDAKDAADVELDESDGRADAPPDESGDDAPKTDDKAGRVLAVGKNGKELTQQGPIQRLGDVLNGSIHRVFTLLCDNWFIQGYLTRDERIFLSSLIGDALDVLSRGISDEVAQRQVWEYEILAYSLNNERKAGRVLAARNASRIGAALQAIIDVLEDAGVDIPGFSRAEPEKDDDDEKAAAHAPIIINSTWPSADTSNTWPPSGVTITTDTIDSDVTWTLAPATSMPIIMDEKLAAEFMEYLNQKASTAPDEQVADKQNEQADQQAGPDATDDPPTSRKDTVLKAIDIELGLLEVESNGELQRPARPS